MHSEPPEQIIVISGDIFTDWNLARSPRSKGNVSSSSADDTTSTSWQCGRAALLADLVEAIAGDLQMSGSSQFSIIQMGAPRDSGSVHPDDDLYHHSYSGSLGTAVVEQNTPHRGDSQ